MGVGLSVGLMAGWGRVHLTFFCQTALGFLLYFWGVMRNDIFAIEPEYSYTSRMVNLLAKVMQKLTELEHLPQPDLNMRRKLRIQSIQGALAMDNVYMPELQIADIWENGLEVVLSSVEIDVRNAINAYREADLARCNVYSMEHFKATQHLMASGSKMYGPDFRCFRTGDGVPSGGVHIWKGLGADRIEYTLEGLLYGLQKTDVHPLIAVPAFHYMMVYMHPFARANACMGWLWQMLLLKRWNGLLAYLPVEKTVYRQMDYYISTINYCVERADDCAYYIEFMLQAILDTANEAISVRQGATPDADGAKGMAELISGKILEAIRANPRISRKDLAVLLDRSQDLIKYHVKKLVAGGRIKHVGPTKGGHWVVLQ